MAFPAQALPTAPVPPSATVPGLSLCGEGSVEHDMGTRQRVCHLTGAAGLVTAPVPAHAQTGV